MSEANGEMLTPVRLAYFSAQAVAEGQDTWAAVMEIVESMRHAGWSVSLFRPEYPSGAPGALARVLAILAVQARLARRLRSFDALYVRAHVLAWPIVALARSLRVAVIQEVNGSWEDAFMAWPFTRRIAPLVRSLQRSQYRSADAIITVSESLATWITGEFGQANVVVSPNGANTVLFHSGYDRPAGLPEVYVVFFGQFAPWQRLEVLLDAVQEPVWPSGVDLVVVGDGQLRDIVERAAEGDSRVHYLGLLPYASVAPVVCNALAAAVLTYAPERAGYSPLKLYEAMACGVPIICSDTPGQAEFVRRDEAGIVVSPNDAGAVATAVAELASDVERARAMGLRGANAVAREYSWDARARQRMAVIQASIGERRRAD